MTRGTVPARTVLAGGADCYGVAVFLRSQLARIGAISVLASKEDMVLSAAFPLGNFVAGILTAGHPWWHAALGQQGPSSPRPANFQAPFEIPDNWNFGHGDYLRIDPASPAIPVPADVPPNGSLLPAGGAGGWQEAWSAAFASTRFR